MAPPPAFPLLRPEFPHTHPRISAAGDLRTTDASDQRTFPSKLRIPQYRPTDYRYFDPQNAKTTPMGGPIVRSSRSNCMKLIQ